jgi:hypothetical protein
VYKCAGCRKQFSVTVGTVFERSKIALNVWLQAVFLLCSSKKGMSAKQIERMLGVTYKTAWFMCHRIREAMRGESPLGFGPLGGEGEIVEADETYFGKTEQPRVSKARKGRPYKVGSRGPRDKRPIVALVERGGNVRTFHVPVADKANVSRIVRENIARESRLHTDESNLYPGVGKLFQAHKTVKHTAGEYVRVEYPITGEPMETIHTNSAEGYFSIFKRGMRGVYQHCKEKHLHRYLAEFDFRYNHRVGLGCSDIDRTLAAIKGAEGKRLMWRQPD